MSIDSSDLDSLCELLVRDNEALPGGIWSWKVYVDGNVKARGPGSTRRSALKLYGRLAAGTHRIVLRESEVSKPDRVESNTLLFEVSEQSSLVIIVDFKGGRPILSLERAARASDA